MGKLQQGINDLQTWCLQNGNWGQQLIQEWTGITADGNNIEITDVSYGNKSSKMLWRCKDGHEWYATILSRTNLKSGCPYCAGKLVQRGINDLATKFPELAKEWHPTLNNTTPNNVSYNSYIKRYWKCTQCGYGEYGEWVAPPGRRTAKGYETGCPSCKYHYLFGGIIVKEFNKNSLYTWCMKNTFGKTIMREWTGQLADGIHIEMSNITYGSDKKILWRCIKGHEWYATPKQRTILFSGCPYCSGRLTQQGINDLKTYCLSSGDWGKQLLKEFVGKDIDDNEIKVETIKYSSNIKALWKCNNGHLWYASINGRVSCKTGCPYCNTHGTSYPEQFIYHALKQIYPNTVNRYKALKSEQYPQGIEYDIVIPDIPLCIEYSSTAYHRIRKQQDILKKQICEKRNIRFINIIEDSYNELEHIISRDYICFRMISSKKDEILTRIVENILDTLGHSINEIQLEEIKIGAFDYSKNKIPFEKSILYTHPSLTKEWHLTLNSNKGPEQFSYGSKFNIWWQCRNCGYEWQVSIHNRTIKGRESGCPNCGYNWYKAQTGQPQKLKSSYTNYQQSQNQLPKMKPHNQNLMNMLNRP